MRQPPQPGLDLRLLVPAVVVWSVSWCAPLVAGAWSLGLGTTASTAAIAVWALGARRQMRHLPTGHHRTVLALALLLGGAAAVGVGFRVLPLTAAPWRDADPSRSLQFVGVVSDDPKLRRVPGWAGAEEIEAILECRVERVDLDGTGVATRVPVRVIGYGAGWADLSWGQRVTFTGRVLARGAADPDAGVVVARGPPVVVAGAPPLVAWTGAVRDRLARAVAGLPVDARGLLPALVVGDTREVPDDLTAAMRISGLAHVTAVSGANVVLLLAAVLALARWIGVRGWGLPVLAVVTVAGFVLLARPDPSVLRAAVMGLVGIASVAGGGRRSGPAALFAAVVGLLLLDPWLARTWGFALSVAATAGLLLLSPAVGRRLPASWPAGLRSAVAVAVAAQIATAPLVVALSGRVSLLGVVANLVAAPAVGPATVLGVVVAAVAAGSTWLAHVIAWAAAVPVLWIAWVARTVAGLPDASVRWPHGVGAGAQFVGLGIIACAAAVARRPRRRDSRVGVAAAVVVAAVVFVLGPSRWPPAGWLFVACDVGQGDALVVPVARGTAVVVDAGPDPLLVDQCLHRLGIRRVPMLLLTHFHADHVEGTPGVLAGRDVGEIVVGPLDEPSDEVARVRTWAAAASVPMRRAVAGELDQVGGVSWQVLWPAGLLLGEGSDPNNNSLVLRVSTGGHVILLTGDVEAAAQRELVASGADLQADVLKVPHHGSASQDPAFLAATGAGLAVISVGLHNTYGHPAAVTLAALAADGMAVRRTDLDGDVAIVAGSGGLRVITRLP